MQGACLVPFNLEKQTALLSVLEPLMARAGNVFIVQVEGVKASSAPCPPRQALHLWQCLFGL
jgi:hypothetical protein